jgi:hypothetical protein
MITINNDYNNKQKHTTIIMITINNDCNNKQKHTTIIMITIIMITIINKNIVL